ncbi:MULTISPECIES: hypothetical protein [unclassified Kitasatospora]|uniref:hypothetical protein n=1 Tax=unclassified Kitasatospora TaxID=2633591 RepID=UPI0038239E80
MPRTLLGALVAAAPAAAGLSLVTPARASAAAMGWDVSTESARRSCVHRPGFGGRRRLLGIDFVKPPIDEAGKSAEVRGKPAESREGVSESPRHLTMSEYTISAFR